MSNADISKYVITHKSPRFIPHETFMAEMVISTYAPQFCFLEDTCNIFNVCRSKHFKGKDFRIEVHAMVSSLVEELLRWC
jgi:hypothetical protein